VASGCERKHVPEHCFSLTTDISLRNDCVLVSIVTGAVQPELAALHPLR
jgi:hypothetical protein